MLPLFLRMAILTMPLSIVQVVPLSVMVTGALTAGLATTGAASAARTSGAAKAIEIQADARIPRGAAERLCFHVISFVIDCCLNKNQPFPAPIKRIGFRGVFFWKRRYPPLWVTHFFGTNPPLPMLISPVRREPLEKSAHGHFRWLKICPTRKAPTIRLLI